MSGIRDLARRLENTADRAVEVVVHTYGEVIGEEMAQDFEDHRRTGKLADTLRVQEQNKAVDFTSQHYRQFVGRFRRGVPRKTIQRARELAKERIRALLTGGGT